MNLQNKGSAILARVTQPISLITGAGFTLYDLSEFLTVATLEGDALQISMYLAKAVAYIAFGLFLPAFSRAVLEHAVDNKE